ncbi:type I restriction-modification system subunit M [Clostridium manihotivorum]|uniref:site-specific DNA-methyltransferase (adenine-specific) n=1 Tax=Clostridium manihotivorum TaxID=2320868 RepID=A0A3R5U9E4_9CLOT|nr:class I SAM-dependent DNA methyltransferase [Clostridium manihotivorum]QAA32758.1 restriction endonuclease subunit M [Clostridium manihotivorum]
MINININEKANLIWSVADKLRGDFKQSEYGKVILPLTVLRRLDCVLEDTKDKVLAKYNELKSIMDEEVLDPFLRDESGYNFYNTSKYTFKTLLDDADNIEANLKDYINGFSKNAYEIIEKFEFDVQITKLVNSELLYIVLSEFVKPEADLHPDKVSNIEMGYIFEELIRKFSEISNETAGEHYTPREVIKLMVNLLFIEDTEILTGSDTPRTIYDPACGTGGMLTAADEYLKELNSEAKLIPFGQELNGETYAVCGSDMLIKGANANNIKHGDTLKNDMYANVKFDYMLSNPPFGVEWKKQQKEVTKEYEKLGYEGRFGAGLPRVSDGAFLFLQTLISKMKPEGSRIAIVLNGSPLFTGDAGSGESNIRKWIIENDWLEAIIALPTNLFYNTGISTYIWVLSNKKKPYRKGKIQLINAINMYEKMRKSLGEKRQEVPEWAIEEITRTFGDFKESNISKIYDNNKFGYNKIVVERPLRDEEGNIITDKQGNPKPDAKLRDTESIPLNEDIYEYFEREVKPYVPDAWIDESKTKIGYEIHFTRYFYEFTIPRQSNEVMIEIMNMETELQAVLGRLFEV